MDGLAVIATVEKLQLSQKQRLVAERLLQPPGQYVDNAELARFAHTTPGGMTAICLSLGVKLMREGLELRSARGFAGSKAVGRAICTPEVPRAARKSSPQRRSQGEVFVEEHLRAPSRVPAAYGLCACCGQPLLEGRDLEAIAAEIYMSQGERRLFDKLAGSFGKWVPSELLIDALYWDDPDGGPETASNVVSVLISNLRPRLEVNGLAIEGRTGRGGNAGRRLVWLETAL